MSCREILFGLAQWRHLLGEVNANGDGTELLREYAKSGGESAFSELVRRQVDLVYSTALRRCHGDPALASEVAQNVFIDLARRARSPRQAEAEAVLAVASLGGWLHRHTLFVAATAMRGESRRRHRETNAMQMQAHRDSTDWSRVAPILDDAMTDLPDRDREALVLRFFERLTFANVGVRLGSSEDAARVRVDRALVRLREALERRGVTSTAAALASAMSSFSVVPAPAGLAATISASVVALPAARAGAAWLTPIRSKLAFGALGGGLLAVILVHPMRSHQRLSDENALLRQQLMALNAAPLPSTVTLEESRRTPDYSPELLRLRGEVARLRRELAEAKTPPVRLEGRVLLSGEAPPPRTTDVPAGLREAFPQGLAISPYQVAADGGLGEVVVAVLNPPLRRPPLSSTPRFLTISNTLCSPRVLAVHTNQPVEIQVEGGPMLNLSATCRSGPGWNRAISGSDTFVKRFEVPTSQVRITDNNHPWLVAHLAVFDHPWFAVTDAWGQFALPPLPAGRYTLEFAHRRSGTTTLEVDLNENSPPLAIALVVTP